MRSTAARNPSRSSTGAQGAVGTPAPLRNVFSTTRSWLIRRIAGAGRTGFREARRSSPSALTFSNSKLITSTAAANSRRPRRFVVVADGRRRRHLAGWAVASRGSGYGSDSPAGRPRAPTSGRADRRRPARWSHSAAAGNVMSEPAARSARGSSATSRVCSCAQRIQPRGQRRIGDGEDRGGQQRRIHRPGPADRQRADRDPGRHLHDRKQAVHPLQTMRFHRHARAPAAASRRRTCPADAPPRRRRR